MPLREGERAGTHGTEFIKSPFPKARFRLRPRRRRAVPSVEASFKLSPDLKDWLEEKARALDVSFACLMRSICEFYKSACTGRERELADEIKRIFPPGTNGISKPFAMPADALRETIR